MTWGMHAGLFLFSLHFDAYSHACTASWLPGAEGLRDGRVFVQPLLRQCAAAFPCGACVVCPRVGLSTVLLLLFFLICAVCSGLRHRLAGEPICFLLLVCVSFLSPRVHHTPVVLLCLSQCSEFHHRRGRLPAGRHGRLHGHATQRQRAPVPTCSY